MFVGDRLREDIDGAAAAGMRTVHVVRDDAQQGEETTAHPPDATISSLAELPALLLDDTHV